MKKNKIYQHGFIGCGKMGQIILQALLKNQRVKACDVLVSRRNKAELKKIRARFKVSTTEKNISVAQSSRILWLGIKPLQAEAVLKEIAPHLRPGTAIVSMMAGVSTATLQKYLGRRRPMLRIMPNTPALLGMGVTGIYFTKGFPGSTQKDLKSLLKSLGEVALLKNEKQFDAVTGLSGSGPAFIYSIAQGFIAGGRASGLSTVQAKALAIQTLWGTSAMLRETQKDPEELIAQVVSKGGTTEAGLKVLKKLRIVNGIEGAVKAATRRSREISRKLK
jgi:pyrroline-5-carboxylate reductase